MKTQFSLHDQDKNTQIIKATIHMRYFSSARSPDRGFGITMSPPDAASIVHVAAAAETVVRVVERDWGES